MLHRMNDLSVEMPIISRSEYGEDIIEYSYLRDALVFISYVGIYQAIQNEVSINDWDYLGVTTDNEIMKGYRIDNRYIVKYVLNDGSTSRLFLKEVL